MTSATTNGRDLLQVVEASVYGVDNADAQGLYQRLCQAESILLNVLSHPVRSFHDAPHKLAIDAVDDVSMQ